MGMGQAPLCLPVSQAHSQSLLCSAPVPPSLPWGGSASHFHSLCKHCGVGQLTHTAGGNVSSCLVLQHCVLCWGGTEPLCLPVHPMRRNTSAPVPAAQGCNCLLPAMLLWLPCPPQAQGGSWGLFGREGELGGRRGSSQTRQGVGSWLMVSALKIFNHTCSCSSGPFCTPVTNAGLALSPPSL